MKLYWFKAQAPRRVLALIKQLGIEADVECIALDIRAGALKTPDYLALNPNAKAPVLVDGDVVLWESSAIMAYLCIRTGADLWPAHAPAEQVEVLRWLSWNDHHWEDAVSPFYFEHIIRPMFGGQPDRAVLVEKVPELVRFATILDAHLQGRRHVACDRLTIADFQLASMAHYWREAEMPLAPFPHLVAWLDELAKLPAWADPWPE